MLYLLLVALIILFIISYFFGGKDFFAPVTVQIITFMVAVISTLIYLNMTSDKYELHFSTIVLVVSCMLISTLIGIFMHKLVRRIKIHFPISQSQVITPISMKVNIIVTLLVIIVIGWTISEAYRIGGNAGNFAQTMFIFNQRNSHSTDIDARMPFALRHLRRLINMMFVIYGFNLIRFYEEFSIGSRILNIIIMLLCTVAGLLGGGRTSTINVVISCIIIFHLLRIQKLGGYKTYSLKFILKIIMICMAILWLFGATKGLVGRGEKGNAILHVLFYLCSGILNLDAYLQHPIFNNDIVGKYTFFSLISNLRALGMNIPSYTVHQEFRTLNGFYLGNVYTFIRIYYADFGIFGVYFFHSLATVILSAAYEYAKKRRGNEGILVFSLMYYSAVLTFFAERFFSDIISISFLENTVIILLLYKFLLQKRTGVSHRRK